MGTIALVHASAGSGHREVARALAEGLRLTCQERQQNMDICVLDILSYANSVFRCLYGKGYEVSAKYLRWFIKLVSTMTDQACAQSFFVDKVEAISASFVQEFVTFLRENKVTTVCCTHFLPMTLLCRLRRQGLYQGSIHVCVTDYAVHGFWFDKDVDHYYVASQEAVERLCAWGIDPQKVHLSGIPVRLAFHATEQVKKREPSERLSLILAASSLRLSECKQILQEIEDAEISADVHLVTGRNQSLLRALASFTPKGDISLRRHGFVQSMETLMHACDLIITKPGGITCSEALAAALPMFFVFPIPMHEVYNATILQEQGAGLCCFTPGSLERSLRCLAAQPSQLACMRRLCRSFAKANAAKVVAKSVLDDAVCQVSFAHSQLSVQHPCLVSSLRG